MYNAHYSFKVMPPVYSINLQWAQRLVGLPMVVPEHWWDGCSGNAIYTGQIAAIEDGAEGVKNFIFKLDHTKEDYIF